MKRLSSYLSSFENSVACLLLVLLTIALTFQILNRYVIFAPFVWIEEIARLSFVWMIYFAIANAARENRHIRVGLIDLLLPQPAVRWLTHLADAIVVVFSLVIAWYGLRLVQSSVDFGDVTPVTNIPMYLVYAVIPVCFTLVALRFAINLAKALAGRDGKESPKLDQAGSD